MKKINLSEFKSCLQLSPSCLKLLSFIFIFGFSTGMFFEILMPAEPKENMIKLIVSYLQSEENLSLLSNLDPLIINILALLGIGFSGYTPFSCPFSMTIIFLKSLSVGYSCALFLEALYAKGGLIIMLTLVPQSILIFPLLFFSAFAAMEHSSVKYKKAGCESDCLNHSFKRYHFVLFVYSILMVLICFLQQLLMEIAGVFM